MDGKNKLDGDEFARVRSLTEYLDVKKAIYPRFYFSLLSLLDMLANGNPRKIMPYSAIAMMRSRTSSSSRTRLLARINKTADIMVAKDRERIFDPALHDGGRGRAF